MVALAVAAPPDIFTDITREAGITWKHFNGESPDRFLIETSSGGAAFFDFDNDGLVDIFLVNGGETPRGRSPTPVRNALYRNLGNGKFENVAERAGLAKTPFYGMGVTVADYDNDGFEDLYITGYPASALFHNNGNGTFTEVTLKAGVADQGEWAAGAAWIDYDRDGFLDLFVCNYAKLSFTDPHPCEYEGRAVYCDQKSYEGSHSRLFHNNGDGTFTDVSTRAGISRQAGRSFGVVVIDADGDGWPDLFVSCDASPNRLLLNKHDGTFEDRALDAEVAYNPDGMARSGMGVDAGDVGGTGRPSFVVTNFHDEGAAIYINGGAFPYGEQSLQSGLAALTVRYVGWGARLFDFDNDGNLDLMIVNGHVTDSIEKIRRDIRYKEPPLLLANDGRGHFRNMQEQAGPAFHVSYAARGMAMGDIDNDGDLDALFVCLNGSPVLLRNNIGQNKAWVGLRLRGTASNRDAIGAKVVARIGDRLLVRWVTSGASFLSSHDPRIVIGLGDTTEKSLSVEILWPTGTHQTVSGLSLRSYHEVVEAQAPLASEKKHTATENLQRGAH
jgi:hypothetical protein